MCSVPPPGVVVAGTAVAGGDRLHAGQLLHLDRVEPAAESLVVAATAVLDELVVVWPQVVELASLFARSRIVETRS